MARGRLEPAMLPKQYKPAAVLPTGVKLAAKPQSVKLPIELQEVLDAMPQAERVALLRKAICDATLRSEFWGDRPLPEWAHEFIQS